MAGSDFGFTVNDLSDSTSIASKLGEGYNPGGSESLTTSASKNDFENQTLTTRDISQIMSRRRSI
jgi:hypothetical protein